VAGRTLQSAFVQVGRLRLHHTFAGRGEPAIVLLHGLGSSGYTEWRYNLPVLARTHSVYAPDLPGFGRSAKPNVRYDLPFFTRVLEKYLAQLPSRSFVLVGASLGARIAMELALRHPRRIARLGLVAAAGLGPPKVQFYYPMIMLPGVGESVMRTIRTVLRAAPNDLIRRLASGFSPGQPGSAFDDRYLDDLREMHREDAFHDAYLSTVRSLVRPRALKESDDLVAGLGRTGLPIQLVWGAKDPLFPVQHALSAHARLPGSRLTVMEGVGHSPQAERPDEFNRVLESFARG
jgi:pimeloyl-ACP methyl ester carboxylesterase